MSTMGGTATIVRGYIAYDPQEDTETRSSRRASAWRSVGYIAYDPQEDTETTNRAWRRMGVTLLHRLRSARGY